MRRLVIALSMSLVSGADARAAGDLGYPGSALKEFERGRLPSFEQAPPLDLGPSAGATAREPEKSPTYEEYLANCFVRVGGRVLVSGPCRILREKDKSVTFELTDKPLVVSFQRSRTWTATLGDRELGKVYKRGDCWGGKGVYACDRGKAAERR
ncbi:MAG: hypothetical protein C3F11_20440 [Methylocystaceae bacterium]|nr:MAG: hypothetical protein C3F11_20440 [Methylocystaceae bacterium]